MDVLSKIKLKCLKSSKDLEKFKKSVSKKYFKNMAKIGFGNKETFTTK